MEQTLLELFGLGGWAMWPLMLFSILTVTLLLERVGVLAARDLAVHPLGEQVVHTLEVEGVTAAQRVCDTAPRRSVASPVFSAALEAHGESEHRLERAAESAAAAQIRNLERGFDLLVALGSIAPITGFLGTVSGMLGAFGSIAGADEISAQLVAGGIFEALITTAFGLAIALVALTGYNLLSHLVDRCAADLEEEGNRLLMAILRSRGTTEGDPRT